MCFDTPNGKFSGDEPVKAWLSCRMRGKRTSLNHKKPTDDASGLPSTAGSSMVAGSTLATLIMFTDVPYGVERESSPGDDLAATAIYDPTPSGEPRPGSGGGYRHPWLC